MGFSETKRLSETVARIIQCERTSTR